MHFLWATCQPRFEVWLKKEIELKHTDLRPSYARPGFVTFKSTSALSADYDLKSAFAQSYAVSLEKMVAPSKDDARFCERRDALANQYGAQVLTPDTILEAGKLYLSVATAHQADTGFEFWFGLHRHNPKTHRPWPYGIPNCSNLPSEAPSRAYLKLEEGLEWSGLDLRAGDFAIELGCAPGGASHALLNRGVQVLGVDPADVAPIVSKSILFTHLRKQAAQVSGADLKNVGPRVFIFSDMNIDPQLAVDAVLSCHEKAPALGGLITLKLTESTNVKALEKLNRQVQKAGFQHVRVAQLRSNRAEVCLAFRQ